jgi:hypothetical protein
MKIVSTAGFLLPRLVALNGLYSVTWGVQMGEIRRLISCFIISFQAKSSPHLCGENP